MAQSPLENVVAHWHKLIENFQTSSTGFYAAVEDALERRDIPGLTTRNIDWNEGGVLSPRREYLRVSGEQHHFDICAAPFGKGYFFSSWLTKRRGRFALLFLILTGLLTVALWGLLQWTMVSVARAAGGLLGFLLQLGPGNPIVLIPSSFLIVLWLWAIMARAGSCEPEMAILEVPIIGWLYARLFSPATYYRVDTMLMFQSAVHSAMLEVIDRLTTQKGLRALSEDERKPIFRELLFGGEAIRRPLAGAAQEPLPTLAARGPEDAPALVAEEPEEGPLDGRILLMMSQGKLPVTAARGGGDDTEDPNR